MLGEIAANVAALLVGVVLVVGVLVVSAVAWGIVMAVGGWLEDATPETAKDGLAVVAGVVLLVGLLWVSWSLGVDTIDWLSRVQLP